jgi:hypothetical protein
LRIPDCGEKEGSALPAVGATAFRRCNGADLHFAGAVVKDLPALLCFIFFIMV